MRFLGAVFVLSACGPSVAVEGEDDGSTSSSQTSDPTAATVATSTTTAVTSDTTATTATTTSATTAGDESTSSSGSGSDEHAGYVQIPDHGGGKCFTVCVECDVWAQDCVDGEKCMAWANDGGDVWNATRCTPLAQEPRAIGETCTVEGSGVSGIDDCAAGAMCFGVDPRTNEGTCVPMCTGTEANPVCPDGLACTVAFDGPLIVCLQPCDPLAPACAADELCSTLEFFTQDEIRFACQPMPPFEPQAYGQPCGGLQICDEALLCVAAEHVPGCIGSDCCTQLDHDEAPAPCPDLTQTCVPLGEPNETLCDCVVV